MPAPEERATAESELQEAEFDAQIAEAGLSLTDLERDNVLGIARYLRRSATLIRAYNGSAKTIDR